MIALGVLELGDEAEHTVYYLEHWRTLWVGFQKLRPPRTTGCSSFLNLFEVLW